MVTVCLTCGSEGFPEWLVFCRQCEVYALHRYCLDGPVNFDDEVTWFCEDCEAEVSKPSYLDKCPIQDSLELKNHIKRKKNNCKPQKKIKKQQKGTKDISGFVGKTKVRIQNNIRRVKKNNHKQQKKITISHKQKKNMKKQKTQCCDNFQELEELVEDSALFIVDNDDSNKKSDCLRNSGEAMNDDLDIVKPDHPADAQPVAEPIWRGSFFICNLKNAVTGLVAHVSSLACSKVWDEAKLFPEVLHADLLQRSALWPKGFKEKGPTNQSIALYIFPETERDEKFFDKLVEEIIRNDLAFRAVLENAELLVFPSTVLPTEYRRFQAKYYLWGVFRGKQALQTKTDSL